MCAYSKASVCVYFLVSSEEEKRQHQKQPLKNISSVLEELMWEFDANWHMHMWAMSSAVAFSVYAVRLFLIESI